MIRAIRGQKALFRDFHIPTTSVTEECLEHIQQFDHKRRKQTHPENHPENHINRPQTVACFHIYISTTTKTAFIPTYYPEATLF